MTLMKENEENKKTGVLVKAVGIVLLAVGVFLFLTGNEYGYAGLTEYPLRFIDVRSLIFVVLFEAGIVLISGENNGKYLYYTRQRSF